MSDLRRSFIRIADKVSQRYGLKVVRSVEIDQFVPEASAEDRAILTQTKPFTLTGWERIWSVINACKYVTAASISGDFIECGVWRGGSTMAAALRLLASQDLERTLWLYDTFEGMSEPTAHDIQIYDGKAAASEWQSHQSIGQPNQWCFASLDDVQRNIQSTGYPPHLVRYVKGKVEDTLRDQSNLPDRIAILRLDTDWYESTRVELEVLYDRVVAGGVVIIDDYGHWDGARKAVDEFLASRGIHWLLHRIDYTSRVAIKP
jgi:O-methyltransferase